MQILWNELKKILTWKMLLLLVAVNAVMYFLFIEFFITHFPNGRPELDYYNVSVEVLDRYGADIDEVAYEGMKETYASEIKKVDDFLQATPKYAEKGLTTYEKVMNIEDDGPLDLRWELYDESIGDTLWELQAWEGFIEVYESGEEILDGWIDYEMSNAQESRINELKETKQWMVFPDVALENYKMIIKEIAVTIFLSIVILISPIFMKDRLGRIDTLQYTAKTGRNLFKVKIIAGFLATFLVVSGLLTIYFSLYATNHTGMFFGLPIHKLVGHLSWYDPTFFQFILLTVFGIYLLAFISATIAMTISSIVPNTISLIGVQIPYVFLLNGVIVNYLITRVINIYVAKWLVPTAYGTLLVASIVFIVLIWKREQKRDIML